KTSTSTALNSKADTTTLNTRVPEDLALRVDTSVGTRIFAGSTMIYGETGRRDVTSLLPEGSTGTAVFMRSGSVCTLVFNRVIVPSTVLYFPITLPGTAPINDGFVPVSADTFSSGIPHMHILSLYRNV